MDFWRVRSKSHEKQKALVSNLWKDTPGTVGFNSSSTQASSRGMEKVWWGILPGTRSEKYSSSLKMWPPEHPVIEDYSLEGMIPLELLQHSGRGAPLTLLSSILHPSPKGSVKRWCKQRFWSSQRSRPDKTPRFREIL